MHDLRSFIALLEETGSLARIRRQVNPVHELAGVMAKLESQGRAFYFEKIDGAEFPAVGGLFNRLERFGLAFGHQGSGPFTDRDFDALIERAKLEPVEPIVVHASPAWEVIRRGTNIDLGALPVPTFFELDSGPFITGAVGITRDPETDTMNVGIYRCLVLDHNRLVINASSLSDLRRIYKSWAKRDEPMPIALAVGVPPAMMVAAATKLPPGQREYEFAGALQGRPLELVRCHDSALEVPANAEFIIEGIVDFSSRVENTLGEFADQYGTESAAVTTIKTISHRSDAIFYNIMAGYNPEHILLASGALYSLARTIANGLRTAIPAIKRVSVRSDPAVGTMAHVAIAIDKQSDDEPRRIIEQAFAAGGALFPVSKITKRIVIVDEDIDVDNPAEVEWAIWSRAADAAKFIVIANVESWEMERAAKAGQVSVRIGIDATMDLEDVDKLRRPVIPGAKDIDLERYL
jgi:2,5-furandicarboxylate decarboxylase 1